MATTNDPDSGLSFRHVRDGIVESTNFENDAQLKHDMGLSDFHASDYHGRGPSAAALHRKMAESNARMVEIETALEMVVKDSQPEDVLACFSSMLVEGE